MPHPPCSVHTANGARAENQGEGSTRTNRVEGREEAEVGAHLQPELRSGLRTTPFRTPGSARVASGKRRSAAGIWCYLCLTHLTPEIP